MSEITILSICLAALGIAQVLQFAVFELTRRRLQRRIETLERPTR